MENDRQKNQDQKYSKCDRNDNLVQLSGWGNTKEFSINVSNPVTCSIMYVFPSSFNDL